MEKFSPENYRALIKLALQRGYEFIAFSDHWEDHEHAIYLRHDVDFSLAMALKLAEINNSLGVRATFCFLLRSASYNLLSYKGKDLIAEIQSLGQHLAFHFAAPDPLPDKDEELVSKVLEDFRIVRKNISEFATVFAWHNATSELLNRGRSLKVPGLINVYSKRFIEDIPYYSDSNFRHTARDFMEILAEKDHQAMHLLLHPLYWVGGGSDILEVLATTWRYLIRNQEEAMRENLAYMRFFPTGLPNNVLDEFVSSIKKAGSEGKVGR